MKLSAQEVSNLPLILIVDKLGAIGEELANVYASDYLVILVSRINPQSEKNIVHVPFNKKIPQVPDNRYEKIFIVDDGSDITRKSVFSFVSLARSGSSDLHFITGIRNIDTSHAEELVAEYAKVKVLVFGDLFDNKIIFDKSSSITRFFLQARRNKRIDVPGTGLSLSFPMTFADTIKLIVKASHLNLEQRILLLFQPTPITDISLAHAFQKANPEITVDFISPRKDEKIYLPQGGAHVISKYDIEQKLREVGLEGGDGGRVTVLRKESPRKNYLRPFLLVFIIFLFVLLLPLLTTLGYSGAGTFELKRATSALEKGDLDSGIASSQRAKTFFDTAAKTSNILISESRYFRLSGESEILKQKAEASSQLSLSLNYFLKGANDLTKIYKGESRNPDSDFSRSSNYFKTALSISEKIKAEGALPKSYEEKINSIKPVIDIFANSSDVLPDILGFDKEKTYLVLLQNNLELRPGGGKIDAYALLSVRNAKITAFDTYDSNKIDQAFSEHVEPPFPIRRYEQNNSWKFSESNFNPDFVKSAISASNLFSLETGRRVDGVIGMNLYVARDLLNILGPVHIEGTSLNADSDNILKLSYENSTDPSFFSRLSKSIYERLNTSKNSSFFAVLQKVGKGITQKNLTFAFKDQSAQDIFTANNWSASLWDERTPSQSTITDYFGLSEANLGKNSVNLLISRSVSKKIVVSGDGSVSSRLQIAIKNSSTKKTEDYKNYLQLILPEDTELNSIFINNKEIAINKAVSDYFVYESRGFTPPSGIEVNQSLEIGKTVFGFLVNIPAGEVQTIALDYSLADNVPRNFTSYDYSLKLYKQSGIDSYPFDVSFDLPAGYRIIQGENLTSIELNRDTTLRYKISQN